MNKSVSNICKIAALLCIVQSAIAGVVDNSVYVERARINSGNELVSTILNNCYNMDCLKSNVLTYFNTILGVEDRSAARSMESVDEQIFDRVAKYLKTNELHFELPETFFRKSEITFRADRGFDVKVSEEAATEGTQSLFVFNLFFFLSFWCDLFKFVSCTNISVAKVMKSKFFYWQIV